MPVSHNAADGNGCLSDTQQVCSALFDVSAFAHAGRSIRTLATTDSFLSADAAFRRLILLSVRTIGVRPDISIATA